MADDKKPQLPNSRVMMGGARQVGAPGDRTLRFVGTDETRDRYNTYFARDGWDFENFRKNPVFLFHHNGDGATPTLPIGRVLNIEKTDATGSPGWAFDVQFAPRDLYPFADVVYNMYREGFMNAVSVGFIAKKVRELDQDEAKEMGFNKGFAAVFERTELTELSAVPVPGNQNALIQREALPAMRALVPEAYRAHVLADPEGEELTSEWFAGELKRLADALDADHKATQEPAADIKAGDTVVVTTEAVLELTNENTAEFAAPDHVTRAEFLEAVSAIADNFTKLFRDLEAMRADVRAGLDGVAQRSTPAPVVPPVVPSRDKTADAPKADPVELLLGENVEALRKLSTFRL